MEEKELRKNEDVEIDFGRIFRVIMNRAWVVIAVSVIFAVLTIGFTFFFVTPKYESAAMFYVNNNAFSVGDTSFSLTSGDLTTSRNLVKSYIVILNTRESLNDVIDYAGVNRGYSELKNMITSSSVNETEIFEVVVTSEDPYEAEKIADAIAYILPKRISSIIEGTSAKVVDAAVVPSRPSSPNYTTNTLIGFLLGFALSVGLITLKEIFNVTIRTEEDVTQVCKHPILASVPNMASPSKGGSYYGYGSSRKKKGAYASSNHQANSQVVLMGSGISFAASEAYKLLRTKLQFSFSDDNNCRVIGLSSALSGEGKSLTSVNLAYTLSQLGGKVILLDCDMRRPTLAEKLGISKKPGLSSYLTGQCQMAELLQNCGLKGEEQAFHVITAGQNPPNPVELLSSERMKKALATLRQVYDYVILDLPPVGEVSDAMAVARETDGMLLVVRQNYCDRIALSEAVRQFEFIESRILGTVFNCATEGGAKYGKEYYRRYYRYSRYSRYSHYGSRYAYADSRKKSQKQENEPLPETEQTPEQ